MTVQERARAYVAKMPDAIAGQGGHGATFEVACVLVKGFSLGAADAEALLNEYNARCRPAWSAGELAHKLREAAKSTRADGYLLSPGEWTPARARAGEFSAAAAQPAKFDPAVLQRMAGDLRVDTFWLANRSRLDPALVDSDLFLRTMFRHGERVVICPDAHARGFIWPDEPLPPASPRGMLFLCNPVDGQMWVNPRTGKPSLRSAESVTSWRYAVLESDEAPAGLWLSALVQMKLPIAAIYTSGGRSVHALVKIDATSKEHWDSLIRPMKRWMPAVGADAGALTAVRLTRLPGQPREEKKGMQRLLYVNSFPLAEPLTNIPAARDVKDEWKAAARQSFASGDIEEMSAAWRGLEYYRKQDAELAAYADDLRAAIGEMTARPEEHFDEETKGATC